MEWDITNLQNSLTYCSMSEGTMQSGIPKASPSLSIGSLFQPGMNIRVVNPF